MRSAGIFRLERGGPLHRLLFPERTGPLLALFLFGLLSGLPHSSAAGQTLVGRLLDAQTGEPIMLGYVALLTEAGDRVAWTLADEAGRFEIKAPDPGSFMVYGESLGYRASVEGPILLGEEQRVPAEFRLEPMPVVLDSIRVVAKSRRIGLVLSGFYEREAKGLGYFIGPEKIVDQLSARRVTDLLWGVPGVRLMPRSNLAGAGYVPLMRAAANLQGLCLPNVYLDGVPMPAADEIDDFIDPMDIEGIEVYRSAAEIPPKFTTAGSACGVILIWSRKGGV